jgi:hypothetical protein
MKRMKKREEMEERKKKKREEIEEQKHCHVAMKCLGQA